METAGNAWEDTLGGQTAVVKSRKPRVMLDAGTKRPEVLESAMLENLYKIAAIVIALALLWIGWELRCLRGEDGVRGSVETSIRGNVSIDR